MQAEKFHAEIPDLDSIHHTIKIWFQHNARSLPWREHECSSWGILVSEIMLQQTPVVRVLPRWHQWMERWPTPQDCGAAAPADVLTLWDRLGYPRRALRLHEAARELSQLNAFPQTYEDLRALPGVGDYTANAILCFAFGKRACVIDTNIRRVQARVFTGDALPRPSLNATEKQLALTVLPEDVELSIWWNKGVMELGALVCTAKKPLCEQCPIQKLCRWYNEGKPEPDYQPKGQSWVGSTRRVRGAIMAVLRASSEPIPKDFITDEEVFIPENQTYTAELLQLRNIAAEPIQRREALQGLLGDGLVIEQESAISFPQ